MSKIGKVLASITMVFALAFGLVAVTPAASVFAQGTDDEEATTDDDCHPDDLTCKQGGANAGACRAAGGTWNQAEGTCENANDALATELFGDNGIVTRIISVVVFIIGALCVIFLIWGGIQYILSAGDSGKVTNAKNTILYAVIGLIICIVAYAIVQFVLRNIKG